MFRDEKHTHSCAARLRTALVYCRANLSVLGAMPRIYIALYELSLAPRQGTSSQLADIYAPFALVDPTPGAETAAGAQQAGSFGVTYSGSSSGCRGSMLFALYLRSSRLCRSSGPVISPFFFLISSRILASEHVVKVRLFRFAMQSWALYLCNYYDTGAASHSIPSDGHRSWPNLTAKSLPC